MPLYVSRKGATEFVSASASMTAPLEGAKGNVVACFWIGTHEKYNRFHF